LEITVALLQEAIKLPLKRPKIGLCLGTNATLKPLKLKRRTASMWSCLEL